MWQRNPGRIGRDAVFHLAHFPLLWLFYINQSSDKGEHEGSDWPGSALSETINGRLMKFTSFSRGLEWNK